MKIHQFRSCLVCSLLGIVTTNAAVRYVDLNSANPTPPYTSWATAATNIQDAVDSAVAGDQILVTNGVYRSGGRPGLGRVTVDKPLSIQSVNGSQATVIEGMLGMRCVYLADWAALTGFTLTNGSMFFQGYGGGVGFTGSNAIVSECVITDCDAIAGGGAASVNSIGGLPGLDGGTLINCTFTRNGAFGHTFPFPTPAAGGAAEGCTLINCTLTGNTADGPNGSGVGGASSCILRNCIVYDNVAAVANYSNCDVNYSCTTPLPSSGDGNITNAPLFVDATNINFRLQAGSPCINAGNNGFVTSPTDVEGKERIVGGTVDMGAYEWVVTPTHYVSLTSPNPTPPYTSWSTAATNIQDAVDIAVAGDQILVTNGVYQTGGRAVFGTMTNRVAVDKPVAVHSVNGPQVTIIQGYQIPTVVNDDGAIRCVYLTNGASLGGFTLTNGATRSSGDINREQCGGGVWCESATVVVSNCAICYNSAADSGGGAFQGTLKKCTLYRNTSDHEGGGAYGSALYNCVLGANSLGASSGGASRSTLNNCLVQFNNGGVRFSTLTNCTVVANDHGGAADCTLINSIVVGNGGGNFSGVTSMANCCTTPYPPGPGGNITENPLFVDWYGANFRLQSNSPCVDKGYFTLAPGSKDLDGRPRFRLNGVDIGAYEFQPGVSGAFIEWLSGYKLPTDGSADYADADSDLLNNWQEWIAGTVPTDVASALRMLNPSTDASGVTVSWQSVSNRMYSLERAINLGMQPAFSPAASNIVGQPGTTSFTDTNALGPGPFFYRVGVGN